ncbi:MAG: CAP domain-containing protein [candidate division KSB1 bacterium]|nr:CAP domain-containing protein [candidate division KSB1 bacterium]
MISANGRVQQPGAWSYTDYNDYTFKDFKDYPAASKRIQPDSIDYKLLHAAVFYATNAQRYKKHLPPFQHSPALEYAARAYSLDMVIYDFFSHKSPVTGKTNLADRLSQVGLNMGYRAENIAIAFALEYKSGRPVYTPAQNGGYFSYTHRGPALEYRTYLDVAETVVRQWMNSPGHRRNILNSNLKYLGIGAAFYRQHDFYNMGAFKITQNFSSEDM